MNRIYGETGMVPVTGKERPMLRPEAASTEARFESASLHQLPENIGDDHRFIQRWIWIVHGHHSTGGSLS